MKILEDILSSGLIAQRDRVLLAVSGGSDSMAMLHIFTQLQKELEVTLAVAHLNHSIRGKRADRDSHLVKKTAEHYGLTCHIKKADVPQLAKTKKLSLEDAARIARYTFFQELCQKHGYNKLALAHTSNDNTETIIMKLLRGTGLKGLRGIAPTRPLTKGTVLVRPLLSFSKQDLYNYCRSHKLKWHEDQTNTCTDHVRNDIRKNIMPKLFKMNPNLDQTLLGMGTVLKAEDTYLDEAATDILNKVIQKSADNGIRLDIKQLKTSPLAIQRRVIRLAMEKVQGDLQDIYLPFIENFLDNNLTTITCDKTGSLKVSKERL